MRLAVLTSQYPTLSHTFIRREIEALRRRGLEVDACSIRRARGHSRPAADQAEEEASTWYVLPVRSGRLVRAHAAALLRSPRVYLGTLARALRHRRPGLRSVVWSLFYFAEAVVLAEELERRAVDHLHNHFADGAATVGMLAAGLLGLPWSLSLHGAADFGPEWAPLLPEKLRAARFVVCVSHFGRAQALRALAPGDWSKVLVSRCGFRASELPARQPRGGGPVQILCVARLAAEKGLPGLLEAFAAVREAGLDAELVLAGDGPEREALAESARQLGIADRCRLLGARTEAEVLELLAGADVFVLASLMEGLPVVLMEAMAMGVPVVAPRLAGIPELVSEGASGLLFAPADWDDLASCLQRLAASSELRERLGEAGREAADPFDVDRAVDPLWRRLVGQGGDDDPPTLSAVAEG